MNVIKNRVSFLRKQNNLSIDDLAKILNVTIQTIYNIENNKTNLTPNIQLKLSEIFKCKIDDLYFNENYINDFSSSNNNINNSFNDSFNSVNNIENNDFIKIKYIDNLNNVENYSYMRFSKEFLNIFFKYSNYDDFVIIKAFDDNFNPVFKTNDLLIVDKQQKEIINNNYYIIIVNDNYFIFKAIRENPFSNKIILKNEKETIKFETTIEEIKNNIIGKIVYIGKMSNF